MMHNPEWRRNAWLEFSTARLIGMPLILLAIFYLSYANNGRNPWEAVQDGASNLLIILLFVWGGYRAASACVEELTAKTWDFQRLSSLSPASLMLGKLFGSTIFNWYGAFFALAAYFVAGMMQSMNLLHLLREATALIGAALFCQALALLVSMHHMQQRGSSTRRHVILYLALGLITAGTFYKQTQANALASLNWYGDSYLKQDFALFSLVLFLGWVLGGLYRSFHHELQHRAGPGFWGAFTLFVLAYSFGFSPPESDNLPPYMTAFASYGIPFALAGMFVYLSLYFDERSIVHYRRWWYHLRRKDWCQGYIHAPKWWISWKIFLLLSFWMLITLPATVDAFVVTLYPASFILACLLFTLRDLAVIHYFNFGPKPKRADLSSAIFLGLTYLLLPALISHKGTWFGDHWFRPSLTVMPTAALLPITAQALIALGLVYRRLKHQPTDLTLQGAPSAPKL